MSVKSGSSVLLALLLAGCIDVNGGAVELSWKLRPASSSLPDKFVDCESDLLIAPVTRIRLDWEVGDRSGFESWRCSDNHGVTGFDLPVGQALLWVTPECAGEAADPATYTAPAPEARKVILGDTVSLGAVEIVVQVSYCGQQPCICE